MTMIPSDGPVSWVKICYGIDLCGDRPVVVKCTRGRAGLEFVDVEPGNGEIAGSSKSGEAVIAGCLSQKESSSRWLAAPFPSLRKARQVFPSLLDIQLPFPIEDCAVDFLLPSGPVDGKTQSLAVVSRLTDMEGCLREYGDRDWDPAVLDQEGVAIWTQSLLENPPEDDVSRVVVVVRAEQAVVVVGRGVSFMAAHSLRATADHISRALHAQFDDPPSSLQWIWVSSDADSAPGLQESLLADWPGKLIVQEAPVTFLARALATRAMTAGPLRCNLRGEDLEHPAMASRRRRVLSAAGISMLAAGVLLCAAALIVDGITQHRLAEARRTFNQLVDEAAGYNVSVPGSDAILPVRRAIDERLALLQPFVDVFASSPSATLALVMDVGEDAALIYDVVSIRGDSVTIAGRAEARDAPDRLVTALKAMDLRVKLDRRDTSAGGKTRFWITPQLRAEGAGN